MSETAGSRPTMGDGVVSRAGAGLDGVTARRARRRSPLRPGRSLSPRSGLPTLHDWRAELRAVLVIIVGGGVVAALWRLLAPTFARAGNPLEVDAAVDGTLVLLSIVAGMVTAACVLMWPGKQPAVRAAVVLAAAALAGVVSWLVGDLLGTPPLRAKGAALVWPIIAAAGMFVGSFVPGLSRRLDLPPPGAVRDRGA